MIEILMENLIDGETCVIATNHLENKDIIVKIDVSEFNYRKNVSWKRVALDINQYFLFELICATARKCDLFDDNWCQYGAYCKCHDIAKILSWD